MSDIAVRVEKLGKLYHLGTGSGGIRPRQQYRTLRETLSAAVAAPFRRSQDAAARGKAADEGRRLSERHAADAAAAARLMPRYKLTIE